MTNRIDENRRAGTEVQRLLVFEEKVVRAARAYAVDTDTLVGNARAALAGRRRWQALVGAAAAFAAAAVLSMLFIRALAPAETIATAAGEWRTLALEDGTEVVLGPRSRARPEYDEDHRTLLMESGEAMFRVAKDRRPFLVRAQRAIVKAVGTEFGISIASSDGPVTVTVQEGRVAVTLRDGPAELVFVAAGEQLKVDDDWPAAPQRVDVTRALSWSRQLLRFGVGDTVGSAVAEFNRRNALQIELDPTLAQRPVRGAFDARDPLSFAQAIGKTTPAVLKASAGTVRLEVREQASRATDRGAPNDR